MAERADVASDAGVPAQSPVSDASNKPLVDAEAPQSNPFDDPKSPGSTSAGAGSAAAGSTGSGGAGAAVGLKVPSPKSEGSVQGVPQLARQTTFVKNEDWQIRVHVIEARELNPRDSNGMSDPVCFVDVAGKKQHTSTFKKTLSCTWDHLMFFQHRMRPEEMSVSKCKISVFDANTFTRNQEIGSYEFDLGFLYKQDGHEIYRRWVALTDTSDKREGVQGYLKVSVAVLGPGDLAVTHDNEDDEEDDAAKDGASLQSLVLVPPSIKTEEHICMVRIYRAEGLPKMDKWGKIDAYVRGWFAGNPMIKTQTIDKSYEPVWNSELRFPVVTPSMSDVIKLEVVDADKAGSDEIISTLYMSYADVRHGHWKPHWVQLYGSPDPSGSSKIEKAMRAGTMEPTAWCGRILIGAEDALQPEPKLETRPVAPVTEPPVASYVLRFDAYEAVELPCSKTDKVKIYVEVGEVMGKNEKTKVSDGVAKFHEQYKEIKVSLPTDMETAPDIMLSLYLYPMVGKKRRIGYAKIRPADVLGWHRSSSWIQFLPDLVSSDLEKDQLAGFALVRLCLGLEREADTAPRQAVVAPTRVPYQLRAHIYQGRNLPAADGTGSCDPYVVVRMGGKSAKGKRLDQTRFPAWYQTLAFDIDLPTPLDQAPELQLLVYDWDKFTSDDFLGRLQVSPTQLSRALQRPTWMPIYENDPRVTEGEVLVSFQLLPASEASSVPMPTLKPAERQCVFEISAVGLRGLLPYKLLPITKAWIEFDCGQRDSAGNLLSVKTKACNSPSSENPNHCEVLQLPVTVPEDPLFAPTCNVRVRDARVGKDPIIGTASINLGDFLPWVERSTSYRPPNAPAKVTEIPGAVVSAPQSPLTAMSASSAGAGSPGAGLGFSDEDHDGMQEEGAPDIASPGSMSDVGLNEAPNTPLAAGLANADGDIELPNIGARTLPDVEENVPTGAEEEDPEVEDKPERERSQHELELSMCEMPFGEYEVTRGRKRGLGYWERWRAAAKNQEHSVAVVGRFKGKFRVLEKAKLDSYTPAPDLQKLYSPQPLVVRVYMLRGLQFVPKDRNGSVDPYLCLSTSTGGEYQVMDKESVQKETMNPMFFKCYELPCVIPGKSELRISAFDWDRFGSDELIGHTTIDLENRWFSEEWRGMALKPLEYRTLWSPVSSSPQGKLELWVELLTPEEARATPRTALTPPVPLPYELRVVVWSTKDVIFKDSRMSDIFVTGTCESTHETQKTDIHWRSENGFGSFNWRMKFPLELPNKVPRIKFQLWDKDMISANDAIAEAILNLKGFYKKAYKSKARSLELPRQWIALTHPVEQGVQGQLEVSLEIMPAAEARAKPAGLGRKEPNEHPVLPKPDRPDSSFAPWMVHKFIKHAIFKRFWKQWALAGVTTVGGGALYLWWTACQFDCNKNKENDAAAEGEGGDATAAAAAAAVASLGEDALTYMAQMSGWL